MTRCDGPVDVFVERALAGEPIDHCLVIDAHGHLGAEFPQFPIVYTGPGDVVAAMDRMGIDRACVSAMPAVFGDARRGNGMVEQAMADHPGRFFGYMVVDAGYPERIVGELERCLAAGFGGVKIWSYGARPGLPYDHPNYEPVFEFAQAQRLPVLAHTWGEELDSLEPIIRRHGQVHWLLAHAACCDEDKYVRLAQDYETVYLETCFSGCPRGLIERFVAAGLQEKVVWGSDAVFMDAAQQLGRVVFAQVAPEVKAKILGLNAVRALRLEGVGAADDLPKETP